MYITKEVLNHKQKERGKRYRSSILKQMEFRQIFQSKHHEPTHQSKFKNEQNKQNKQNKPRSTLPNLQRNSTIRVKNSVIFKQLQQNKSVQKSSPTQSPMNKKLEEIVDITSKFKARKRTSKQIQFSKKLRQYRNQLNQSMNITLENLKAQLNQNTNLTSTQISSSGQTFSNKFNFSTNISRNNSTTGVLNPLKCQKKSVQLQDKYKQYKNQSLRQQKSTKRTPHLDINRYIIKNAKCSSQQHNYVIKTTDEQYHKFKLSKQPHQKILLTFKNRINQAQPLADQNFSNIDLIFQQNGYNLQKLIRGGLPNQHDEISEYTSLSYLNETRQQFNTFQSIYKKIKASPKIYYLLPQKMQQPTMGALVYLNQKIGSLDDWKERVIFNRLKILKN